jgi:hypothetical protein
MVVVNQMTANLRINEPDWIPATCFARARMTEGGDALARMTRVVTIKPMELE